MAVDVAVFAVVCDDDDDERVVVVDAAGVADVYDDAGHAVDVWFGVADAAGGGDDTLRACVLLSTMRMWLLLVCVCVLVTVEVAVAGVVVV